MKVMQSGRQTACWLDCWIVVGVWPTCYGFARFGQIFWRTLLKLKEPKGTQKGAKGLSLRSTLEGCQSEPY